MKFLKNEFYFCNQISAENSDIKKYICKENINTKKKTRKKTFYVDAFHSLWNFINGNFVNFDSELN